MIKHEGVICVLKPPGMSSSDAVTDIRRIFGEKRVGHTGTLDPAAAGVLPICIGRATRLFDYLVDKRKEYIAEIAFGAATDTEDSMGVVLVRDDRTVTSDDIERVLPQFVGEIQQTPPIYSALNVNGVKMYKLARRGEVTVPQEAKKRSITINELELIGETARNRFLIRISCSKGTYVRTLCKDIGVAIGVPAYMAFLLRTMSGEFKLEDAYSIAELNTMKAENRLLEAVIPIDRAIPHIPELRLEGISNKNKRLLVNGAAVMVKEDRRNMPLRVYCDNSFLGIGIIDDNGELRVTVWLGREEQESCGAVLHGTICENKHIGKGIGFPTANIQGYSQKHLPEEGVYVTVAELDGISYPAVTSIGTNPTVGGTNTTVETHLIGYEGECYGRSMTVRFMKRLRGMVRFESVEDLKKQIQKDVEDAKRHLSARKYTERI